MKLSTTKKYPKIARALTFFIDKLNGHSCLPYCVCPLVFTMFHPGTQQQMCPLTKGCESIKLFFNLFEPNEIYSKAIHRPGNLFVRKTFCGFGLIIVADIIIIMIIIDNIPWWNLRLASLGLLFSCAPPGGLAWNESRFTLQERQGHIHQHNST